MPPAPTVVFDTAPLKAASSVTPPLTVKPDSVEPEPASRMPPELTLVVPDSLPPATNSSVPPRSTVVLLTVVPETSRVMPLLTTKPESGPPMISVAPLSRWVPVLPPPLSTSSVPPLDTVVLIALPPDSTTSRPPANMVAPFAIPETICVPPLTRALKSLPWLSITSTPPLNSDVD